MTPRLTAADRRDALIDTGAAIFAARPFAEVRMQDVATVAGISRALLYRHFPTKRDLFAAIYQRAAHQLVAVTALDPALPLDQQVLAGLDAHLDYFVAHKQTVLAANRDLAGDPGVQAIINAELDVLRTQIVDVLAVPESHRALVSAVVTSWLIFVRALCVDWLLHDTCNRDVIRDVCAGALTGALTPLASWSGDSAAA